MKKVMSVLADDIEDISKLRLVLSTEMPDVLFVHRMQWAPYFNMNELIKEQDMLWCLDGHKMEIRITVD